MDMDAWTGRGRTGRDGHGQDKGGGDRGRLTPRLIDNTGTGSPQARGGTRRMETLPCLCGVCLCVCVCVCVCVCGACLGRGGEARQRHAGTPDCGQRGCRVCLVVQTTVGEAAEL